MAMGGGRTDEDDDHILSERALPSGSGSVRAEEGTVDRVVT